MILFIALCVEADFVVIVFKSFIYVWYELPISTFVYQHQRLSLISS